jgi:hypothetical protein
VRRASSQPLRQPLELTGLKCQPDKRVHGGVPPVRLDQLLYLVEQRDARIGKIQRPESLTRAHLGLAPALDPARKLGRVRARGNNLPEIADRLQPDFPVVVSDRLVLLFKPKLAQRAKSIRAGATFATADGASIRNLPIGSGSSDLTAGITYGIARLFRSGQCQDLFEALCRFRRITLDKIQLSELRKDARERFDRAQRRSKASARSGVPQVRSKSAAFSITCTSRGNFCTSRAQVFAASSGCRFFS